MHTPLVNVPLIGMPGLWEWIIIGLAIVLLFGATKLPKLGKGLGEGILNFKKGLKGSSEENNLPMKVEGEEDLSPANGEREV